MQLIFSNFFFCFSESLVLRRAMSSLVREKAFVDGAWVAAASGKTFEVQIKLLEY